MKAYIHIFTMCAMGMMPWATATNQTIESRASKGPVVQIYVPRDGEEDFTGTSNQPKRSVVPKADPNDVEVLFPVASNGDQQFIPRANPLNPSNPNNNNNFNPFFGVGVNPAVDTGLDAFTARKAIDLELLRGGKIRFLDTVTQLGIGWNNLTSEFVCNSPGFFFFTFTTCGELYRHFRVTLRHNGIGIVSTYGDVNGYQMATNAAILRLLPGDKVYLQLDEGGIYEVTTLTGRAYNTFTGFRIL